MKLFEILIEELNQLQREYVDSELGGDKYNPEDHHQNMFDSYEKTNPHRIVLPYDNKLLTNNEIDMNIRQHLAKNGWGIHDYHAGLASRQVKDREGNDKLEVKKIGKILQDTGADKINHPEMNDRLIKGGDGKPLVGSDGRYKSEKVPQSILHFYNNDQKRSSKASSNIVISRDKEDIAGMSSGRSWEMSSCMRLPHGILQHTLGNHRHIKDDFKKGTLIAYSVKRGDDDIQSPMGRVLIKQFHTSLDDGSKHTIYRTEQKPYGDPPSDFKNQVESLMQKHYPAKSGHVYKIDMDLYNDGRAEIQPVKIGLHKGYDGTNNYNSEGKLHDYLDENGVKQPASKFANGNFTHFKDGLEHNEDGIAKTEITSNGTYYEHFINGQLHRLGGQPASYYVPHDKDDDSYNNSYAIGGQYHRDGDLPAMDAKHANGDTQKTYFKYGLRHRDGDLPAVDTKRKNGDMEQTYYKYGQEHMDNGGISSTKKEDMDVTIHRKTFGKFNSPDNNTPAYVKKSENSITKKYYKDNQLHRDNDLPAEENETTRNGITKVAKIWFQHGSIGRTDNNKPYSIEYNKDTKEVYSKVWSRPEGSNKPNNIRNVNGITTTNYNKNNVDGIQLLRKIKDNKTGETDRMYSNKINGKLTTSTIYRDGSMEYYNGHEYKLLKDKQGRHHLIGEHGDHILITKDGHIKSPVYGMDTYDIFKTSNDKLGYMVNDAGRRVVIPDDEIINKHFEAGLSAGGEVAAKINQLKKLIK